MKSFLVEFEPVSAITIFTALYKRVEAGEWTDNEDLEVENFVKTLDRLLARIKDKERSSKLCGFRDDLLKQCKVESPWIVDATNNFKILTNEVHKLAFLESEEKDMWQAVEEINIEKLGYDHPLCSEILDNNLEPFNTIPKVHLVTSKLKIIVIWH
ncbi:hypothetical protein C2G38_2226234 [Gigaspora rosea]|uniref:Uncharacterized protein n=1 Tax=Gigaspora rosea TaxID=44941 RepID=A0A397TYJ7_9GLOM|nr:hypothetical protein C2G38_2226234 [Gigaspora rosea]